MQGCHRAETAPHSPALSTHGVGGVCQTDLGLFLLLSFLFTQEEKRKTEQETKEMAQQLDRFLRSQFQALTKGLTIVCVTTVPRDSLLSSGLLRLLQAEGTYKPQQAHTHTHLKGGGVIFTKTNQDLFRFLRNMSDFYMMVSLKPHAPATFSRSGCSLFLPSGLFEWNL